MRMSRLTAGVVAATAAVLAITAAPASAAEKVTVRPSSLGNHWYTADSRFAGTPTFETTFGGGSQTAAAVAFRTPNNPDKGQLLTDAWADTRLADITTLTYETYRSSDSVPAVGPAVTALNLRVRLASTDVARTLVYEPYLTHHNDGIAVDAWQTWDAIAAGAKWWATGKDSPCTQDVPCTWQDIVAAYPGAVVQEQSDFPGSLGFNQGSYNAGTVAAADMLHVATGGRDVTYDFELDVTLSNKDQCKDGGWATSTAPTYRNQGDCVSSFASKKKLAF
jgi:hypothetical protein